MPGVAPGQRVGEARDQALVVRVADVVHVAFGRMEAGALLGDDVGARVLVVQPRRRRLTGDVEDDLDAGGVHLVHDPVEGLELEPAFGGFEVVPRQVAHAHDLEAGLLHQRDVALDLLGAAVDRLVAGADEELAGAGPVGAALGALGVCRAMAEHGDGQRARDGQLSELRDHLLTPLSGVRFDRPSRPLASRSLTSARGRRPTSRGASPRACRPSGSPRRRPPVAPRSEPRTCCARSSPWRSGRAPRRTSA